MDTLLKSVFPFRFIEQYFTIPSRMKLNQMCIWIMALFRSSHFPMPYVCTVDVMSSTSAVSKYRSHTGLYCFLTQP